MRTDQRPDIEAVLLRAGADTVPAGHGWRSMRCPFHEDSNASAAVNIDEGAFTCHACGVHGDAWALIMAADGCDFLAAVAIGKALPASAGAARGTAPKLSGRKYRPPGRRGRR